MIIISSQIQTNLDKFRQVHPSQNYSLLQCIADLDKLSQCRQIQTNLDKDSQIQTKIDRYNDQCNLFKSTVMQTNTTNMHKILKSRQIWTNLDRINQNLSQILGVMFADLYIRQGGPMQNVLDKSRQGQSNVDKCRQIYSVTSFNIKSQCRQIKTSQCR